MLRKIKLLAIISFIDFAIFIFWVAVAILPFSPFRIIFAPLRMLLSDDIISSTFFEGYILPLFILPVTVLINIYIINLIDGISTRTVKYYFSVLLLSIIPILLIPTLVFGPIILNEKLQENSTINNFSVEGDPTFILQSTAKSGNFNFLIKLPVRMKNEFKGAWIPNYFNVRLYPTDKDVLSKINTCKYYRPHLLNGNFMPLYPSSMTSAGKYEFIFEYSFSGDLCNKEELYTLMGEQIELLNITTKEPKVLKTFPITSIQFE